MPNPADILAQKAYWPVKNSHGTEAPAYAVLQVTGFDSTTGAITVSRPTADDTDPTMLMVNGPSAIPASGFGSASYAPFDRIAYDTGDGTPAVGADWGTEANSWLLQLGAAGFKAWGGAYDGSAVFARSGGAAGIDCVRVLTDWSCTAGTVTKTYTYLRGVDASSTPCS